MRRLMIFLVTAAMLLSLGACAAKPEDDDFTHLYYLRREFVFGQQDAVIACENRPYIDQSMEDILDIYLAGPQQNSLISPFPRETRLLSVSADDDAVHVALNKSFASLSGVELTLACCCLTQTVMALTDAVTVVITADGALLDGEPSVTMDAIAAAFFDHSPDLQPADDN